MTYYLKNGNTFTAATQASMDLHEKLPVGNYVVKMDAFGKFFLEHSDSFELPAKLYGDTTKRATRILNTFDSRSQSTGVLLQGEKGSGKTLLAKTISAMAAQHGIPTLLIDTPFCGADFNSFIEMMEQPMIVFFDEFEKVYDHNQQSQILTLFDGTVKTQKLFVLTVNDSYAVSSYMINRPGRIFYSLCYEGLSPEFIKEYIDDNLKNKNNAEDVIKIGSVFNKFNFDMLKALVEEMNRYDETAMDSLKMLNINIEKGNKDYKITKLIIVGHVVDYTHNFYHIEPFTSRISFSVYNSDIKKAVNTTQKSDAAIDIDALIPVDDTEWEIELYPADIAKIENGQITYVDGDGDLVEISPVIASQFDFRRLF